MIFGFSHGREPLQLLLFWSFAHGCFSKYVFIVAPGLTVKSRLQVLQTGGSDNYYIQFNIVPIGLMDKLRQGKVMITNWQALSWDRGSYRKATQRR